MTLARRRYGADVPRFVGTDRALLLGPGGTNIAGNPRAEDAVIGTPGTLPTGWAIVAGTAGLSLVAVTAKGVFNGVSWTEYELQAASAGACGISVAAPTVTDTLPYTGQSFVAWPGAVPAIVDPTNSGLRLGNTATVFVQRNFPTDGAISTPVTASWTANATGATDLQIRFTTTGAGTFRVRAGWNDLKQQAFLTNPVLAASGPAAIGADLLGPFSLSTLGIGDSGASTWQFDFTFPSAPADALMTLWNMHDTAGSNGRWRVILVNNIVQLRALTATFSNIGAISTGVRYGCAVTVRGDGTGRAVINGVGSAERTDGIATALSTAWFGSTRGNSAHANATYRRMQYLPYAVSNAQLDTFAAEAAAWS